MSVWRCEKAEQGARQNRDRERVGGKWRAAWGVSLLTLMAWPQVPLAQNVDDARNAASGVFDPGQVEQRLQSPERAPLSEPEPLALPRVEPGKVPKGAEAVTFTLNKLSIEGGTLYDNAHAFEPFYQDMLGQEITLTALFSVCEKITVRYRNDGYILSKCVVPAQSIKGGAVKLRIVEGFIDNVDFQGEVVGLHSLLVGHARELQRARPLSAEILERHLLLINDLSGLSTRAVLTPSKTTQGGTDLTLVLENEPFEASLTLDNRGSVSVGPVQASFSTTLNSLFGLYERITISGAMAGEGETEGLIHGRDKELAYGAFTYLQPINWQGTAVQLSGSVSESKPGDVLSDFHIVGNTESLSLDVMHPLLRRRQENLSLRGGFKIRNSRVDYLDDDETDVEDRLRVLSAGLTYDLADSWDGVSLFDVSWSQGLTILDSSRAGDDRLSRAHARPDFSKVTVSASRLQYVLSDLSVLAGVNAQYAFSQLPSSEEFGVGGSAYGRAYDSSELSGDHGFAGKMELRYDLPLGLESIDQMQIYGFGDAGTTWARAEGTKEERWATSAGVGLRWGLFESVSGSIEVAWPLTRPVSTKTPGYGPRLFFSLTASY